jgi:telomere length regulation protein
VTTAAPVLTKYPAVAKTILLVIGYLHRQDSNILKQISQYGSFLTMVSTRLSSSVPRARYLGMVVATAMSRAVDDPDKTMDFGVEELESTEARELFSLTSVSDEVGTIDRLTQQSPRTQATSAVVEVMASSNRKAPNKSSPVQQSKVISIEEIEDDSDEVSGDEDLMPYAKPDDDPSDSDEDPTLINREKPTAPVYVIDLIKQLQNDEKPDAVELALQTAPSLIRRKASFGTELSDNVQVLASVLINLKSPVTDDDENQRLRLQSLVACLVSFPRIIAPWLASMYYEGDFSLAQRASVLSTVGMGAREVAGLDIAQSTTMDTSFPSRRLPSHLAAVYAPMEHHAYEIQQTTLQPLALAAADKISGPDALKVRTFSSRLAVEKRRTDAQAERSRRIPKDVHALLSSCFFLPLCSRLGLALSAAPRAHSSLGSVLEPTLLRLYLQTLVVVLHALGPNAVQLRDCIRETLIVVETLSHMPALACEPAVLPAVLHLLLVLLDMGVEAGASTEEALVTEFGRSLMGVVEWVNALDRKMGDGAGVEVAGMDWNILAAAVMVKWRNIGRKFQGRMLGLMGMQDVDIG